MKRLATIVFSVFILFTSCLTIIADGENTTKNNNEIVYLNKETFKTTINSIASNVSEGSTFNLYFGNNNDYDVSSAINANYNDNSYYSIYYKQVQDNNVYDIYVLASDNGKVYFPENSSSFFKDFSTSSFF